MLFQKILEFVLAGIYCSLSKAFRPSNSSIGTGIVYEAEELKELWEFILLQYGNKKGFPAEDIYYILTGDMCSQEEYNLFNAMLYESKYFIAEIKRPYIFHAVLPEELKQADQQMEVNQALELAENMFAPYGLYKKGAKFQEKIIVLYFNFPGTALNMVQPFIKEFEEKSKWTVQLNEEIHVNAAVELIEKLLTGCRLLKNPSYHRVDNCFRIVTDIVPVNYKDTEQEFLEMTGINLYFNVPSSKNLLINSAKKKGQTEQNTAFSAIEHAFIKQPDKLYKKSIKADSNGTFIELSFISPEIGMKYQDEIDNLEASLGWRIEIGMAVNQNEILKIGRSILQKYDLLAKKNISYHPDKRIFSVQVLADGQSEAIETAKREFEDVTGLRFEIIMI